MSPIFCVGTSPQTRQDGNASYRNYITDGVYELTGEDLERSAGYEVR